MTRLAPRAARLPTAPPKAPSAPRRPRNRRTSIAFPVFRDYTVHVILSHDMKATGRRLHEDLSACDGALVTYPATPRESWLVLGPDPSEDTIAHEAAHAVRAILDEAGAGVDDEVFAYHLGYLVGKIHGFIKKGTT